MTSASPLRRSNETHADSASCDHPRYWRTWTILLAAVLLTAAAAVVLGVLGWSGPFRPWSGPFPLLWPFFPLGFFVLFFLLFGILRFAWWGPRWGWGAWGAPTASAKEVLRIRFARGEITREQLRQMARDLDELG